MIAVHMLARTFMTRHEAHARSIFLRALEYEGQEADRVRERRVRLERRAARPGRSSY